MLGVKELFTESSSDRNGHKVMPQVIIPCTIIFESHAGVCATIAALKTADRQSHRHTSNAYGILTLSGSRAAGILLEGQSPKRRGYYITDAMKVGKTILRLGLLVTIYMRVS